jgi:predicted amidohydrolase
MVVLIGGIISNANPYEAAVVDSAGVFLMPGLIDPQAHVTYCSYLTTLHVQKYYSIGYRDVPLYFSRYL